MLNRFEWSELGTRKSKMVESYSFVYQTNKSFGFSIKGKNEKHHYHEEGNALAETDPPDWR